MATSLASGSGTSDIRICRVEGGYARPDLPRRVSPYDACRWHFKDPDMRMIGRLEGQRTVCYLAGSDDVRNGSRRSDSTMLPTRNHSK